MTSDGGENEAIGQEGAQRRKGRQVSHTHLNRLIAAGKFEKPHLKIGLRDFWIEEKLDARLAAEAKQREEAA
jgi:hypothetical protein